MNRSILLSLCYARINWAEKSLLPHCIKKLCKRGVLQNKDATVTALFKREDVQRYESRAVLKNIWRFAPKFLTAFLNGRKLSEQEAGELKRIIEEASK